MAVVRNRVCEREVVEDSEGSFKHSMWLTRDPSATSCLPTTGGFLFLAQLFLLFPWSF